MKNKYKLYPGKLVFFRRTGQANASWQPRLIVKEVLTSPGWEKQWVVARSISGQLCFSAMYDEYIWSEYTQEPQEK